MHHNKNHDTTNTTTEYLKFVGIMGAVLGVSALVWANKSIAFFDAFMGVFFVVFGGFKLANLKVFAYGFQSYDLLAKKSLTYSFTYPFIQVMFGLLYLEGRGSVALDLSVIIISLISGAGVLNSLFKKQSVHCVCLGNVIKLPLSTISFVEDFGMALMAIVMLINR